MEKWEKNLCDLSITCYKSVKNAHLSIAIKSTELNVNRFDVAMASVGVAKVVAPCDVKIWIGCG